jgi:predicted metal-binding membrane protein
LSSLHCERFAGGAASNAVDDESAAVVNSGLGADAGRHDVPDARPASPPCLVRELQTSCVRSIGLFIAGYASTWLVMAVLLVGVELVAMLFLRQPFLTVAGALVVSSWQFSPMKQRCLNRIHAHTALSAFGLAADRDALWFGVTHGVWCIGSCWALMLLPMLLPKWSVAAMGAVFLLVFSERLDQPTCPCWTWRVSGKLTRIIFAQVRVRLI